jgi:hypothetical protein
MELCYVLGESANSLDQLNSIVNTKKIDEVEVMVVFAVAAVVVTTFLLGVHMGDKIENKNKIKPSENYFLEGFLAIHSIKGKCNLLSNALQS